MGGEHRGDGNLDGTWYRDPQSGRHIPPSGVDEYLPFGLRGPYSAHAGNNPIAEAMGGLMYIQGDDTQPPCMSPYEQGVHLASVHAVPRTSLPPASPRLPVREAASPAAADGEETSRKASSLPRRYGKAWPISVGIATSMRRTRGFVLWMRRSGGRTRRVFKECIIAKHTVIPYSRG
jgi:hypothetical protein